MSVAQYDTYIDLKTLKSFRKRLPNHYGILAELGRYYFHNDHRKALQFFFQSLDMAPQEDGEIFLLIARLYYDLKKYTLAADYFNKAERLIPFSNDQLHTAAWSFQEIEEYQKAIYYYEKFLEKSEDHVDAWVNLGYCYGHMEESQKALECSLKALQISPNHEVALLNTGFHYWIIQDLLKAQKYTEMLLRINPCNDYALMNMGHIHLCLGNIQKSNEYYQKSVLLFQNIKEFEFLFKEDYKYMKVYGLSREKFYQVKDRLIVYWKSKK